MNTTKHAEIDVLQYIKSFFNSFISLQLFNFTIELKKTRFMKNVILLTTCFLVSFTSFSQRGKNNDYTVTTQNTEVNAYTPLTQNALLGATTITMQSTALTNTVLTSPLESGDLILIIQMQGASMDIDLTPTVDWGGDYTAPFNHLGDWKDHQEKWGAVTSYNQAGKFEYAQIANVLDGTTVELSCALKNAYTTSGHTQIVRVPRFANLTVNANASITAPAWNGSIGGIVAIEIDQNLNLPDVTSIISVNGKGFRGGQSNDNQTNGSFSGSDPLERGYLASSNNRTGAEKGEGIGGGRDEYIALYSLYCKSAPANGGGGGNNHNAGGGGGSNVGTGNYLGFGVPNPIYASFWNMEMTPIGGQVSSGGGRGGYSYSTSDQNENTVGPNNNLWSGDKRRDEGGLGGHPLTYDPTRLFFGGGGGAGDQNFSSAPNQVGIGGNGGGLILLDVFGSVTGSGSIQANGATGGSSNPTNNTNPGPTQKVGNDAAGGGGAGGTIRISNNTPLPSSLTLQANGGAGGNQAFYAGAFAANPTMEADGPGGGGTGGLVTYTSGTPQVSILGGNAGTTNSTHVTNFPVNGATGGATGITNTDVNFYDLQVANANLCGGASASTTLTATVIGTLPVGSTVIWFDEPFAGNAIATGLSYTTPNLTQTTTYYVGICPGDFRIPVTITIGEQPTISGTPTIIDASCTANSGSITGLTVSGGQPTYTFEWNGQVQQDIDFLNANAGSYTLVVTDQNGCTAQAGPFDILSQAGPFIDDASIVITPSTCQGSDGSIEGIQTDGIVYIWNGVPGSLDLFNIPAGSYSLIVEDANGCQAVAGPYQITQPAVPSVDETNLVITPATCGNPNGSITGLQVSAGIIQYEWNGDPTMNQDLIDVPAGVYSLIITSAEQCSFVAGPYTIPDAAGPTIEISNMQITNATCNTPNGSITGITTSGGTAPLTISWSNNVATLNNSNIAAGSYTLTVTDANGCTVTSGPHIVNTSNGPQIDASQIDITTESCAGNDASITGIVVTGTGLTYNWNGTPSTLDQTNISAGDYTLIVTDNNGCIAQAGPFTVVGATPISISSTGVTIVQPSCGQSNGSITGISVTGESPLTSVWTPGNLSTLDISNLAPGAYTLTVTSGNGCTATSQVFTLNSSSAPDADYTYSPTLVDVNVPVSFNDASTGTISTWNWLIDGQSFTDENPSYIFTLEGSYPVTLLITDANGCTDEVTKIIQIIDDLTVPNVLTLNNDGINDVFEIQGLTEGTSLIVLNRWGNVVYSTSNYLNDWKGIDSSGAELVEGVYTYSIKNVKGETIHGFLHLFRD